MATAAEARAGLLADIILRHPDLPAFFAALTDEIENGSVKADFNFKAYERTNTGDETLTIDELRWYIASQGFHLHQFNNSTFTIMVPPVA